MPKKVCIKMKSPNIYVRTFVFDVLAIKKIERHIGRSLTSEELESLAHDETLFLNRLDGSPYDYEDVPKIPFKDLYPTGCDPELVEKIYNDQKDTYRELRSKKFIAGPTHDYKGISLCSQVITFNQQYADYFQLLDDAINKIEIWDSELIKNIIELHALGKSAHDIEKILVCLGFRHPKPRYRNKKIGKDFILARISEFEIEHDIPHIEFN